MKRHRLGHCLLGSLLLAGCAHYQSQPLSKDSVEQVLAVPDDQSLRIAASQFRHPVLQPIEINPQSSLSPDQVAVLSVIVNPDLRADRNRRAVAQAQLMQAGLLPNPQLSAGVEPPIGGPDPYTGYNLGISWD